MTHREHREQLARLIRGIEHATAEGDGEAVERMVRAVAGMALDCPAACRYLLTGKKPRSGHGKAH